MNALFFNHNCEFLIDKKFIVKAVPLCETKVATTPYIPVQTDFSNTTSELMNVVYQFQLMSVFKTKDDEFAIYMLISIKK